MAVRAAEGSEVDGAGDGKGDWSDGMDEMSVDVSGRLWDDQLGEVGGGGCDSSDEVDGVVQERGERRRLDSSSLSRNNSTSHCLLLMRFAGRV
jgi:hypothetical protein